MFHSPEIEQVVRQLIATRHERGVSQRELDDMLGVAEGQVAKWETGARSPTAFLLTVWATGLGMELGLRPVAQGAARAPINVPMTINLELPFI